MHLLDNYPFLIKYFENGIKSPDKTIAHSLLFYGSDLDSQYQLATYIARLLNCKKDKNYDCNCLDCRWIIDGEHPAVLTYTRKDNYTSDSENKAKKNITVAQAEQIKQSLLISSDFHRVFIFCDRDNNNNIAGLNRINFPDKTANALLKSIEEPPENTTFIFLTKDKNDVISTIISRCQCFFVPSFNKKPQTWSGIKDVFENYFEFERSQVFDIASKLDNLSDNKIDTLEQMQNYILSLMKSNMGNKQLQVKLLHDAEAVELAKKQIIASVKSLNAFENLCLNIIK